MRQNQVGNVCVALPTVNELRNLQILIPQIRQIFKDGCILIIDDNSTDGTREYLELLKITDQGILTIYRSKRLGIGSAHMAAMNFAIDSNCQFLITMDADLTHDPFDALLLLDALQESDFVVGSRYLGKSDIQGWSKFRLLLTHSGHIMTQIFFRSDLDMSSGLRAYRVSKLPIEALRRNCPQNYEFFFISALVFIKSSLKICQVRVQLSKRGGGKSKMSWKMMLKGISQLFYYSFRIKRITL